jgi:hypothetical protein
VSISTAASATAHHDSFDYNSVVDLNEVLTDPEDEEDKRLGLMTWGDDDLRPLTEAEKAEQLALIDVEIKEEEEAFKAWQARDAARILAEYDAAIDANKTTRLTRDLAERARRYVSSMAPSIQSSNGSGALFNVCRVLYWDFGLSVKDALQIALYYNETRADPPWKEKEIIRKLKDAQNPKHQNRPRGHLSKLQPIYHLRKSK